MISALKITADRIALFGVVRCITFRLFNADTSSQTRPE